MIIGFRACCLHVYADYLLQPEQNPDALKCFMQTPRQLGFEMEIMCPKFFAHLDFHVEI